MKIERKFLEENPKLFLKKGLLHTFTFQKNPPEKIEYVSHDEYDSLLFYQTDLEPNILEH